MVDMSVIIFLMNNSFVLSKCPLAASQQCCCQLITPRNPPSTIPISYCHLLEIMTETFLSLFRKVSLRNRSGNFFRTGLHPTQSMAWKALGQVGAFARYGGIYYCLKQVSCQFFSYCYYIIWPFAAGWVIT